MIQCQLNKLCLISLLLLFIPCVMVWSEVKVVCGDGYFATITYANDEIGDVYIIGSFQNWIEPGIPMIKNSDGLWEVTIQLTSQFTKYQFFNPEAKSEFEKYIEDPDPMEWQINAFGTRDAVIRRPHIDDDWYINMIPTIESLIYSTNIVRSSYSKNIKQNNYDNPDTGKYYIGDVSSDKTMARIWYQQGDLLVRFRSGIHGNVAKHLRVDLDIEAYNDFKFNFDDFWTADLKDDQMMFLQSAFRDSGSGILEWMLFPFNEFVIHQLVLSLTWEYVDISFGGIGYSLNSSQDPMGLLYSRTIGSKDNFSRFLEMSIRPPLSGFELFYGFGKSDDEEKRWFNYLSLLYDIQNQHRFYVGFIYSMASWSPAALDSFANANYMISAWTRLKPVDGLELEFQVATQLPTRYFNDLTADNYTDGWDSNYRISPDTFDFPAHSAAWAKISYAPNKVFNLSLTCAAGGSRFSGMFAKEGSLYSGIPAYSTIKSAGEFGGENESVVGGDNVTSDYFVLNYSKSNNQPRGAQIRFDYNMAIRTPPERSLVFSFLYRHIVRLSNLDGLSLMGHMEYQDEKYRVDNSFQPGMQFTITTKKGIKIDIIHKILVHLTVYQDEWLNDGNGFDGEFKPGIFWYLDHMSLDIVVKNPGGVLKRIEFLNDFGMDWYPFYWDTSTTFKAYKLWSDDRATNGIVWKALYYQLITRFQFNNTLSLSAGFVFRYFHGDGYDDERSTDKWILWQQGMQGAWEEWNIVDEERSAFNFGIAAGVSYVIPVKLLRHPRIYCNLSIGWKPYSEFNDDSNRIEEHDQLQRNNWKNGIEREYGVVEEMYEDSNITLGISWDF